MTYTEARHVTDGVPQAPLEILLNGGGHMWDRGEERWGVLAVVTLSSTLVKVSVINCCTTSHSTK